MAAQRIREKLADGTLSAPPAEAAWFGRGVGRPCDGCELPISKNDVEVELNFLAQPTIRLHRACHEHWRIAGSPEPEARGVVLCSICGRGIAQSADLVIDDDVLRHATCPP